ncbi:MAG: hypothetical protein K2H43_00175, partial [Clostridia bacterium]|nr:hypothetical protein [Clostridia bacterium]
YYSYREQLKAYREFKTARVAYNFRLRFYAHGWAIANPPRPVLSLLSHKLLISVSAIALAALIAAPSAVLPTVTNMFRPNALAGFKLGATDTTVRNVLPRPDDRTDNRWEYYSRNYAEILTEIRQNEEEIENTQDMQTVEKLQAKNRNLYNRLGRIEYKYIAVSFDLNEYGEPVVSHVLLDTARCNADPHAKKEVKSLTLMKKQIGITDTFANGVPEIPTQIYYTDGSFQRYYLPASAFSYVDFSQTGVYRIEWFDVWGNYTANLTVTR